MLKWTRLLRKILRRYINLQKQDIFYKQVTELINEEKQYLKVKTTDNIYVYYRGKKREILDKPEKREDLEDKVD